MGADLYITRLENKILRQYPYPKWNQKIQKWIGDWYEGYEERKALRKEYGSYYRDSYNGTNVMWMMDFSYWKTPERLEWDFHKNGNLSVAGVKQFLQYLQEHEVTFLQLINDFNLLGAYLNERHVQIDNDRNSVKSWRNYFEEKYVKLTEFLKRAIKIHSSIIWSV